MASDSNSLTESPTEFEKPSTTWSSLTSWAASVTVRILTLVSALGNGTPKNVSTAVTASQVVILMTSLFSIMSTVQNIMTALESTTTEHRQLPRHTTYALWFIIARTVLVFWLIAMIVCSVMTSKPCAKGGPECIFQIFSVVASALADLLIVAYLTTLELYQCPLEMPWVIDMSKMDSAASSLHKDPLNSNASQESFSSDNTAYTEESSRSSNNVQEIPRSPNSILEAVKNTNNIQEATKGSNDIQKATNDLDDIQEVTNDSDDIQKATGSPNIIQGASKSSNKREPIKRKPVPQLTVIPIRRLTSISVPQPISVPGEYPTEFQPATPLPPKLTGREKMNPGKLVDDNSAQQKKAPSELQGVSPKCTCHYSKSCTPDPKSPSPVPTPKKKSPERSLPNGPLKKTDPAPKSKRRSEPPVEPPSIPPPHKWNCWQTASLEELLPVTEYSKPPPKKKCILLPTPLKLGKLKKAPPSPEGVEDPFFVEVPGAWID